MDEGSQGVSLKTDVQPVENAIATGSATINESLSPGEPFELIGFELHLDAAPTTSEDFVVKKNCGLGAVYDVVLYTEDLSSDSTTDIVNYFGKPIKCYDDSDVIDFDFANTDTATYGLQVFWRRVA